MRAATSRWISPDTRLSDGTRVDLAVAWFPIIDAHGHVAGVSLICRDVTERRRAEAQRKVLEARLNETQRLDSLGQLAGGIAHDFNNLLAVILNYASFVAEAVQGSPSAQSDVEQIRLAAESAARLVQQLLIFGRQETVQPVVIDVNEVVTSVRDMLSRTLGEHIELAVRLDPRSLRPSSYRRAKIVGTLSKADVLGPLEQLRRRRRPAADGGSPHAGGWPTHIWT